MHIYHICSISLSLDAHSGYFHTEQTTLNSAAMNMGVLTSLPDIDFNSFGCRPRTGIAGSSGSFVFKFEELPTAFHSS